MSVGGVVLNFSAETKGAIREIDRLTRSVKEVGDKSTSTASKLKKIGKVGVAAVAAGAALGAVALFDFAKAAYADEQAADKLDFTLRKLPGTTDAVVASTRDWIDQMEIATGIADDDLRGALGRLAVVTEDVAKAQQLAILAADASTASGKSYTAVVTAMAKAAGGNTAALQRLFPQLDAGPDKVLTLSEAVDQLTDSYGGAAKAAEDNDLFGRLGTIWGQLKEALGQVALPTLEALATWFADGKNLAKLQGWITKIGEWATTIGVDIVTAIKTKFIPFVENELLPAIQSVYDYFQSADGKAQIKSWGDALSTLADAVGAVLTNLDKLFRLLDKLPGNKILQALGLIPKLSDLTGSGGTVSAPSTQSRIGTTLGPKTRPVADNGSLGAVNVTVVNGKQEPALDSAALAIRLARNLPRSA